MRNPTVRRFARIVRRLQEHDIKEDAKFDERFIYGAAMAYMVVSDAVYEDDMRRLDEFEVDDTALRDAVFELRGQLAEEGALVPILALLLWEAQAKIGKGEEFEVMLETARRRIQLRKELSTQETKAQTQHTGG